MFDGIETPPLTTLARVAIVGGSWRGREAFAQGPRGAVYEVVHLLGSFLGVLWLAWWGRPGEEEGAWPPISEVGMCAESMPLLELTYLLFGLQVTPQVTRKPLVDQSGTF